MARAICESTEADELGSACILTARYETPRNSVTAEPAISKSVRDAFCDCGCRNAVTPFEIDSTPVSAAEPEANAFSRTNSPSAPAPVGSGCGTVAVGHVPSVHLPTPTASIAYMTARKAYVGNANISPDSRTPRRFPRVRTRMQPSESSTRCEPSEGAADVIAKTPAATETATVRM